MKSGSIDGGVENKNFLYASTKTTEACRQQSESMCEAQGTKGVSGYSYQKAGRSLFPCSYPCKAQCRCDRADKHGEIYADDRDNNCCHDTVKYMMQKRESEAGVSQLLTRVKTTGCVLACFLRVCVFRCVCVCVCA